MDLNSKLNLTELDLAEFSERLYCRMTSRGATAIFIALQAIGRLKGYGDVIVPAIGCLSIPQVVRLSGHNPVFADVSPLSGCLSVEDLSKKISKKTKVILPIHIFGHAAPISQICELALSANVEVIEDACHALGGIADGKRIGSWGMFSIASFGGTKPLGGMGGGALLFDDPSLGRLVDEVLGRLPSWPPRAIVDLLALSHRNIYHAVVDYRRASVEQVKALTVGECAEQYRSLLISSDTPSFQALEAIRSDIQNARNINEKRLNNARYYDQVLSTTPCQRMPINDLEKTGTVWRYTFLCPSAYSAQLLTNSLRKAGLHASNQYWSLSEVCNGDSSLKNARWFQERVVNLWVDNSIEIEHLENTAKVISEWNLQF